ncbi:MAG: DUF2240 family protein [Candidatus Aenigmarchaeota archaeon]|nr:DUF2240 family protein [Candidatus Aenigmarchaeota archaeon]
MIEEIIKKISEKSGKSEKEIKRLVSEKIEELSGLISDEGAAHIVAKELGVDIIEKRERRNYRLNIGSVVVGMRSVDVVGKVSYISPVKEFKTNNSTGCVASVYLVDETGSIRLSLWNEETEVLDKIDVGDTIRVQGYVKDNRGTPELRLGKYGKIMKSDEKIDVDVGIGQEYKRKKICELTLGMRAETRATLVQVFETKPIFEVCPICGKRVKKDGDAWVCEEHGEQEPKRVLLFSGVIDDGTGNIRAVGFRENAEKLFGIKTEEAVGKDIRELIKGVPLGKEFIFRGRVKKNDLFDRLEFMIEKINDVVVLDEIKNLLD